MKPKEKDSKFMHTLHDTEKNFECSAGFKCCNQQIITEIGLMKMIKQHKNI